MLFLLHASETPGSVGTDTRMGLPQFKAVLQAAKVTSVLMERVEELYMSLQASPVAAARSVAGVVPCELELGWVRQSTAPEAFLTLTV